MTRDDRTASPSDKQQFIIDTTEEEMKQSAKEATVEAETTTSFNTHTVDNKFAQMHLNTDLVEEAKLAAKQKQEKSAMTADRIRSQQEEA